MGHETNAAEDRAFHREKYGRYCQYCGAGEFDNRRALEKHEARCWKNPEVREEIQKKGDTE